MLNEEIKLCECGCGQFVKPGRRYIHGHHLKKKSEEMREKISRAKKGRTKETHPYLVKSEETIKKMRLAHIGKHPSEETKRKIREAHIGKKRPKEFGEKISRARKGKTKDYYPRLVHSKEHNKKIGDAQRGMKKPEWFGAIRRGKTYEELFGVEKARVIKEKRSKENHWNWQGGVSRFPYPFDFSGKLKNLIRERDEYTCQLCGRMQRRFERQFDVHHIDYNKDNLDPRNLTILCHPCNCKVNSNRLSWTKFFQQGLKLEIVQDNLGEEFVG